jgi:hypothetical protein
MRDYSFAQALGDVGSSIGSDDRKHEGVSESGGKRSRSAAAYRTCDAETVCHSPRHGACTAANVLERHGETRHHQARNLLQRRAAMAQYHVQATFAITVTVEYTMGEPVEGAAPESIEAERQRAVQRAEVRAADIAENLTLTMSGCDAWEVIDIAYAIDAVEEAE